MAVVDQYRKLTEITQRMRDAARLQDWDQLAETGHKRDALLASLPKTLPPLSATESALLRPLIEEILSCHAEISDHASPWLEHTRTLLAALDQAG